VAGRAFASLSPGIPAVATVSLSTLKFTIKLSERVSDSHWRKINAA
jgi:hypothetical protein